MGFPAQQGIYEAERQGPALRLRADPPVHFRAVSHVTGILRKNWKLRFISPFFAITGSIFNEIG